MIWHSNRLQTRYCNVYNSVENPVVTHEICEVNRYILETTGTYKFRKSEWAVCKFVQLIYKHLAHVCY